MEEKSKLQLIGEIAQADNKNLELIEEINEKEDEIDKLQRQKEELQVNGLRQETLFKLEIERLQEDINNYVNIVLHERKEIDRLNNIINELEKYLNERSEYTNFGVVLDKIKELKGSDNNE